MVPPPLAAPPPPTSTAVAPPAPRVRASPSSMETVDCGLIVPVYAPQGVHSNRTSPRGSITSPVSVPLTATTAQQLLLNNHYSEQSPMSPTPSPQPPQPLQQPAVLQAQQPVTQQPQPGPTTVGHIVPVAVYNNPPQMRVKLPPGPLSTSVSSSHPCKNTSCEFYGTPELDYFCSKCSKKAQLTQHIR